MALQKTFPFGSNIWGYHNFSGLLSEFSTNLIVVYSNTDTIFEINQYYNLLITNFEFTNTFLFLFFDEVLCQNIKYFYKIKSVISYFIKSVNLLCS